MQVDSEQQFEIHPKILTMSTPYESRDKNWCLNKDHPGIGFELARNSAKDIQSSGNACVESWRYKSLNHQKTRFISILIHLRQQPLQECGIGSKSSIFERIWGERFWFFQWITQTSCFWWNVKISISLTQKGQMSNWKHCKNRERLSALWIRLSFQDGVFNSISKKSKTLNEPSLFLFLNDVFWRSKWYSLEFGSSPGDFAEATFIEPNSSTEQWAPTFGQ